MGRKGWSYDSYPFKAVISLTLSERVVKLLAIHRGRTTRGDQNVDSGNGWVVRCLLCCIRTLERSYRESHWKPLILATTLKLATNSRNSTSIKMPRGWLCVVRITNSRAIRRLLQLHKMDTKLLIKP